MWSRFQQAYVQSPYAVPRPKNQRLKAHVKTKETDPDEDLAISNLNQDETIKARNKFVKETCVAEKIPICYFTLPSSDNELDTSWARETSGNNVSRKKLHRLHKIFESTLLRVRESWARPEKYFDYWIFQASLKLGHIFKEANWLKSQILVHDFYFLKYRSSTAFDCVLVKQLQRHYGPISESDLSYEFLACCRTVRKELANKSNKKLQFLWEYYQKFGKDAVMSVIDGMTNAEIEALNLLPENPGFTLLDLKEANDSIYDANPVTNLTHSEWFLLPRFRIQPGPSSLFIRHDTLEDSFLEFQKPQGVIVVDGYWPSLIDLTSTHPVRWCDDPLQGNMFHDKERKRNVNRDPYFWNSLHENMRREILWFPLGIEADLFMEIVKLRHNYEPDEPLFPGLGNKKAAKLLPDLFVTSKLPGSAALILFPAFLRRILPNGDMPALGILRRIWKKIIFTVRINGMRIRSCDLIQLYRNYWKVDINPSLWGFEFVADFIQWCLTQWGEKTTEETLILEDPKGTKKDAFLVYQPRPALHTRGN